MQVEHSSDYTAQERRGWSRTADDHSKEETVNCARMSLPFCSLHTPLCPCFFPPFFFHTRSQKPRKDKNSALIYLRLQKWSRKPYGRYKGKTTGEQNEVFIFSFEVLGKKGLGGWWLITLQMTFLNAGGVFLESCM